MKDIKHDITSESAWKKTSQFIQEKYGKRIEFKFLSVTSDSDIDHSQAVSSGQRSYIEGDDLVVPLKYKNTELGSVVVCRGATLPFEQQQETADLIHFLIEPQAYNRMLELKLNSSSQPEEESNVIRLFGRTDYVDEEEVSVVGDGERKRRLVSSFIHIKSKSAQARHKIALKIHDMIGTIVFLRLQDVADGSQPVTHEMDLSDTTLYIEDLTALNQNQMDLLERLARRNLSDSRINCAVIVGSGLDEDQIQHLNCSMAMKNDLLGLAYDADRVPVTQQASTEILDLLFFNDDDMIS